MNTVLFVILLAIFAFIFKTYFYDGTKGVVSTLDGKIYDVRQGPYEQRKADLLSFIKMKLTILVQTLRKDPQYNMTEPVLRLLSNWERGISIKEIGNMESDAAYVINKQHMAFCLQDKPYPGSNVKTTNLEDTNLISYVAIHELAHMMSDETGHGSEFVSNFEFLLDYSKDIDYNDPFTKKVEKLYIPLNQLKTSDNYCGVSLTNAIN
jgi:hypothetical protein